MRKRGLLVAFLLSVVLCSFPILVNGEIDKSLLLPGVPFIDYYLLQSEILYVMNNPTSFLAVLLVYDFNGDYGSKLKLPENVNTEGRVIIAIHDNRGIEERTSLLIQFESILREIYSYISAWVTDMDNDIVGVFYSKEEIPLGYFYRGKYHLGEGEGSKK